MFDDNKGVDFDCLFIICVLGLVVFGLFNVVRNGVVFEFDMMIFEMLMDFRCCWVEWLGGGKKLLFVVCWGIIGMVFIVVLVYDMVSEVLLWGFCSYW